MITVDAQWMFTSFVSALPLLFELLRKLVFLSNMGHIQLLKCAYACTKFFDVIHHLLTFTLSSKEIGHVEEQRFSKTKRTDATKIYCLLPEGAKCINPTWNSTFFGQPRNRGEDFFTSPNTSQSKRPMYPCFE